MIVEYEPDPQNPDGRGMILREVPDGDPFVWHENAADPQRRRARVCLASNIYDVHPQSQKPYDRRVALEIATGHYYWLEPETPVVVVRLKAVPVG